MIKIYSGHYAEKMNGVVYEYIRDGETGLWRIEATPPNQEVWAAVQFESLRDARSVAYAYEADGTPGRPPVFEEMQRPDTTEKEVTV